MKMQELRTEKKSGLTAKEIAEFILEHSDPDTQVFGYVDGRVKTSCNDHYPKGTREKMGLKDDELNLSLKGKAEVIRWYPKGKAYGGPERMTSQIFIYLR